MEPREHVMGASIAGAVDKEGTGFGDRGEEGEETRTRVSGWEAPGAPRAGGAEAQGAGGTRTRPLSCVLPGNRLGLWLAF